MPGLREDFHKREASLASGLFSPAVVVSWQIALVAVALSAFRARRTTANPTVSSRSFVARRMRFVRKAVRTAYADLDFMIVIWYPYTAAREVFRRTSSDDSLEVRMLKRVAGF